MTSTRWLRTMPMVAILVAALAASAGGGCGGDPDNPNPNPPTGGTGGDGGGTGGTGGAGGTGGVGGTGGGEESCEKDEDCPSTGLRCDEETGKCVPKCKRDRDCGLNKGLRCDQDTGRCVPGEPCDQDGNCDDYCSWRLRNCYCQEDQSMQQGHPPRKGVCWRKLKPCDLCERDEECGEGARCVPYNYGGETMKVCLPKGSCPEGMLPYVGEDPDLIGFCVPQYGDCAHYKPCKTDDDCDRLNPVCDKSRGVCVPGCGFNFQTNRSFGCPPQQVCHLTTSSVNPQLIGSCELGRAWGFGKCGSPCEADDDCQMYGPGFVCGTYGTERRCVPEAATREGGCLSDEQCEVGGQTSEYIGYCDLSTFTCVQNRCRLGLDWRLGCEKPFEDCTDNFKCVVDPDTGDPEKGQCVKKDCVDKGGAEFGACLTGWFCNGERYRDPFTGEHLDRQVQAPQGTPYGECFPMNASQWCVQCGSAADCPKGVTDSENPPACVNLGMAGTWCAPGCTYQQDCPADWRCEAVGPRFCVENDPVAVVFKICADDADCGGGGRCVYPTYSGIQFQYREDHLYKLKVCTCDPTKANACGDPSYECNAGIGTAPPKGEIKEHYCVAAGLCGPGGSCEFFGDMATVDDAGRKAPVFYCANDGGRFEGVSVSCPEGYQPGGNPTQVLRCYQTQACIPALVDGVCGPVEPAN